MHYKVGDTAYLARKIIEPATGDHPAFLMGVKGEKVTIQEVLEGRTYPYKVTGSTNGDNAWYCSTDDLMWSKPFKQF